MTDFSQAEKAYFVRMMNQHEIDKAIRLTKGPRHFDPLIRKIWDRLLKKPRTAWDRQFRKQWHKAKWNRIHGLSRFA